MQCQLSKDREPSLGSSPSEKVKPRNALRGSPLNTIHVYYELLHGFSLHPFRRSQERKGQWRSLAGTFLICRSLFPSADFRSKGCWNPDTVVRAGVNLGSRRGITGKYESITELSKHVPVAYVYLCLRWVCLHGFR